MKKEIKIPDIAENVENGTIASILVSEGDEVTVEQPLVAVETDKATTEIPSDYDGVVKELKVTEGDNVSVNQVIAILEVQSNGHSKEEETTSADDTAEKNEEEEKKEESGKPKTAKKDGPDEKEGKEEKDEPEIAVSPLARKIARENDVNLSEIEPSGLGNRISRADVEALAEDTNEQEVDKSSTLQKETPKSGKQVESMNRIDQITANTMQNAWQTIPHVTQFDEADISDLEKFRNANKENIKKQGGKLTITAILVKISAFALQKYTRFNTSIDQEKNEIHYHDTYHIGIAVDTPQGLLVPVVRNVNKKSLSEIAVEITELSQKARNKKLTNDQMQGGTFTISNLGGIGGTGFTPIVYPPQVAILGVSRAKNQLVYKNEEFKKRLITPLSLSYDHRVINGADGARFLRWMCEVVEDPHTLLF